MEYTVTEPVEVWSGLAEISMLGMLSNPIEAGFDKLSHRLFDSLPHKKLKTMVRGLSTMNSPTYSQKPTDYSYLK